MLKVNNISKTFGDTEVLHKINFTVRKGSITGLLGPNGAGKTTTMRIICGFLTPTKGDVRLNSASIRENPIAIKSQIGYLPENNPLYQFLTPKEYLEFIAKLKHVSKNRLSSNVNRVIDACGIGDYRNKKIEILSRGYQQRVGLAAALIGNPQLLVLDEPTTGLDPNQQTEIRELIKKLKKTVLFSSHILSEVQQLCDTVVLINKGRIVFSGPISSLSGKKADKLIVIIAVRRKNKNIQSKIKKAITSKEKQAQVDISENSKNEFRIVIRQYQHRQAQALKSLLVQLAQENNWQIVEIKEEKQTIEESFRKLTQK
jgi:ABC-2 type transport system ATP-binding protein